MAGRTQQGQVVRQNSITIERNTDMSIHIGATPGDIAETVLLPGDPLRAQFIAEKFLQRAKCISTVRNMLCYTGTSDRGNKVSVLGAGMGMPMLSIYAHELINEYGAKRLIRVGSCGSFQTDVKLRDIIFAAGACSDSAINLRRFKGMSFAPIADFRLLNAAHEAARNLNIPVRTGSVLSTDLFYHEEDPEEWKLWAKYGVLAAEMETAELYTVAARKKIQALSVLTVSDSLVTHEKMSAEEREKSFTDMIRIVLEIV
jgi:purine-nucleoside phosphorylase